MSKYQLTDLLNEITGTGRIGTYMDTYRGLVNKIDDLKEKGIRVKELGMSGDGKTPFEFEVYPGDKDEAFSVYPYKFDPSEGDDMEIHRFSIGGKPVAIRAAKELLGDGAMSNAEVKDGLKYLDDAGDDTSDFSDLKEQDDAEGFVDELQEEEGFTEVNVDEIKFHLDAYENGTIDGDDLHKAISEILFGEIKAPGMREDTAMSGAVADELEAGAIGDRVAEGDSIVDEHEFNFFKTFFGIGSKNVYPNTNAEDEEIEAYLKSDDYQEELKYSELDEKDIADWINSFLQWREDTGRVKVFRQDIGEKSELEENKALKEHFQRFMFKKYQ